METSKKFGDNGGVASAEAVSKKDGRKRKKRSGAVTVNEPEKERIIVVSDDDEGLLTGTESPPGLWATRTPSQLDTAMIDTGEEKSPVSPVTKKAKVAAGNETEEVARDASTSLSAEENDHLRSFFVRGERARKNSLVGQPIGEVAEVVSLFKARIHGMADEIWENRGLECAPCQMAGQKMSTVYNMTRRMLSMLLHRERDMESKMAAMENRARAAEQKTSALEAERDCLEEERVGLRRQLEELHRRERPTQERIDAATSTDTRMEVEEASHTAVDSGLLEAIDKIVVGRLKEWCGPHACGPTRDGEQEPRRERAPLPSPTGEGTSWAQISGHVASDRGKKEKERTTGTPPPALPRRKTRGTVRKEDTVLARRPANRTARKWPRLPETAAVTLTVPPEASTTYTEVLAVVRKEIPLEDLGIPYIQVRRASTGGLILGV